MRIIKRISIVLLIVLYSCGASKYPELENGLYADIETVDGNILLKLEYKNVPITVGNFVSLAEGTNKRVTDSMRGKPFYNGLKFHRVMSKSAGGRSDFMIQGGCPLGLGTGNPGYKFQNEFPLDSVGDFLLKHDGPGVLSMANSGANTNGSQFFITLSTQSHLDGVHSVFGHVVKGQEVAFKTKKNAVISKIDIIRVGRDAKRFKAYEALEKSFNNEEDRLKEIERLRLEKLASFNKIKENATELSPDFLIHFSKKGDGPKPALESKIRVGYAVYFSDGKLLETNNREKAKKFGVYSASRDRRNVYEPFDSRYSMNVQLVQGFKDGLLKMQFGDKIVLFVPSHLAYGAQGRKGIAPNTDLIFELEMFPPK